jgi:hypothetical protein
MPLTTWFDDFSTDHFASDDYVTSEFAGESVDGGPGGFRWTPEGLIPLPDLGFAAIWMDPRGGPPTVYEEFSIDVTLNANDGEFVFVSLYLVEEIQSASLVQCYVGSNEIGVGSLPPGAVQPFVFVNDELGVPGTSAGRSETWDVSSLPTERAMRLAITKAGLITFTYGATPEQFALALQLTPGQVANLNARTLHPQVDVSPGAQDSDSVLAVTSWGYTTLGATLGTAGPPGAVVPGPVGGGAIRLPGRVA